MSFQRDNLARMITLAEECFSTKNDPSQLSITPEIISLLREIHPGTMKEERDENGPIAWILVIPTTHDVMEKFLRSEIDERELFDTSCAGGRFEAIYMCSALVLPEYRKKGLAERLTADSINSICKDHPIKELFYWAFSEEGKKLAAAVAHRSGMPLYQRTS